MLESHLLTYGRVLVVRETDGLLCSLFMNYLKFHIEPSCWVDVGGMASHKGVSGYGVWGNFIHFIITCFHNMCALTFLIVMSWRENLRKAMISITSSLSVWLYCIVKRGVCCGYKEYRYCLN